MCAELVEPVAVLLILIGTISSVGSTLVSELGCWSPWIWQSTWPVATKRPCWSINHPTGGITAKIGKGPVGARFALFHCAPETHERNYSLYSGQSSTIGNSQRRHSNERRHGSSVASSSVEMSVASSSVEMSVASSSIEESQHSQKWTCSIVSSTAPETCPRVRLNGRGP